MAKQHSTDLLALAVSGDIDNSPVTSPSVDPLLQPHSIATSPVLGLVQLEVIKAAFSRRIMQAVATVPDAARQRDAIITGSRKMGAELVAKFNVRDVVDIPSGQFAAAHQFVEDFVLAFGHKAGGANMSGTNKTTSAQLQS